MTRTETAEAVHDGRTRTTRVAAALKEAATPGLILPALVVLVVVAWIAAPGLFTGYSPVTGSSDRMVAPGPEHWFGTDQLGRDIFSRFVYGSRVTFFTAGIAVLVGFVFGGAIGLVTATLPSAVDVVGMRLTDALISVPSFLIAILIATSYGRGSVQVGIGVGIGAIALFARVSRAEILKVSKYDFVQASRLAGSGYARVVLTRLLPNSIGSILSLAVVEFAAVVIAIAALGYLGFGAPPPEPEWGLIISEGRNYLGTAWWISILPSIAITLVVLSIGAIGRWLARRFRI